MPLLRVTSVENGMILAKDAADDTGAVVVPAGTVVTKAVRNRLLMAHVRKVTVRGDTAVRENGTRIIVAPEGTPPEPEVPDDVLVQQALLQVAHMFNEHRDDRLMRKLCRLAIKCAEERLISV